MLFNEPDLYPKQVPFLVGNANGTPGGGPGFSFEDHVHQLDPTRIEVRERRLTAQNAANAVETNITFTTEDVDTDNQWSVNLFTAALDGIFTVTLSGTMESIPTNRFFAYVSITSALTGVTRKIRNSCIFEDQFYISVTIPLKKGDTFTVGVFHTSGVGINITDAWLEVIWDRP